MEKNTISKNIAILSSGSGNSSKKLLENISNNKLNSNISVIITNRSNADVIKLAIKYKISYVYLPKKKNISDDYYDNHLLAILKSYNIDCIFLIDSIIFDADFSPRLIVYFFPVSFLVASPMSSDISCSFFR